MVDLSRLLSPDEDSEFVVSAEEADSRLDHFLADHARWTSRSAVRKSIDGGMVTVNGAIERRAGHRLQAMDRIVARLPKSERDLAASVDDLLPLETVFDGGDFVIVEKPHGIPAHPAGGAIKRTLLVLASLQFPDRCPKDGPRLPHRLDKETSGLSVITFTDERTSRFAEAFRALRIERRYDAICRAIAPPRAPDRADGAFYCREPLREARKVGGPVEIDARGKPSETVYFEIARENGRARLRVFPVTGRAHQIRAHLAHIGLPIVGDPLYGDPSDGAPRMMLHAAELVIPGDVIGRPDPLRCISGRSIG